MAQNISENNEGAIQEGSIVPMKGNLDSYKDSKGALRGATEKAVGNKVDAVWKWVKSK